jgi:hypothetical protein
MKISYKIDASKWKLVVSPEYRKAMLLAEQEATEIASDIVHAKTLANVSGPRVGGLNRKVKARTGRAIRLKGRAVTATRGRARFQLDRDAEGKLRRTRSLIKRQLGSSRASLPVPRVTGNLARSIKKRRLLPGAVLVYQDERLTQSKRTKGGKVYSYGKVVHDGSGTMPARPYMGVVVRDNRRALIKLMDAIVKLRLAGVSSPVGRSTLTGGFRRIDQLAR